MALNPKRRKFVEEYLVDFNATQAAIRAGYSPRTAYSQGSRLLKNVEISDAIETRLDEVTMSANEALYRLNQQARGDLGDYIGLGEDDLIHHPQRHLLKKVRIKTVTRVVAGDEDDETETEQTIDLELYDAQSALKEILKIRRIDGGKATDRSEHTHSGKLQFENMSDDELDTLLDDG